MQKSSPSRFPYPNEIKGSTLPDVRCDDEDMALLRRWSEGDTASGERLLLSCRGRFDQTCARFGVMDADTRMEVFQSLVLMLLKDLKHVPKRIERSFGGWFRWQVRDAITRHRRKDRSVAALPPSLPIATQGNSDHAELMAAIRKCAQTLPEAERAVFELRFFDGHSVAEVASSLGKAANAVSQAIFRLSKRMRSCLLESGVHPGGLNT